MDGLGLGDSSTGRWSLEPAQGALDDDGSTVQTRKTLQAALETIPTSAHTPVSIFLRFSLNRHDIGQSLQAVVTCSQRAAYRRHVTEVEW